MDKDRVRRESKRPFRHSSGKGDRPRPIDMKKYRENYDRIFGNKENDDDTTSKETTS